MIRLCSLVAVVTALMPVGAVQAADDKLFNSLSVQTPFDITHSILAVDVLPDAGKELLVFGVDGDNKRWMSIYKKDQQSYKINDKIALPDDAYAFDIGEYVDGQLQQIYVLTQGQLNRFEPSQSEQFGAFIAVSPVNAIAIKSSVDFISKSEFVQDVNGDGRVDIFITDFAKTNLLLGQQDGSFLRQELPIKPNVLLFEGGATYSKPTIYVADMNLDGATDLVTIGEGELQFFAQAEQGLFTENPSTIAVEPSISGLNWWDKRDAFGENLDQSQLVFRSVETLEDINNDQLPDLIVRYTQSSGVLDRVNDYEIYLGQKTVDGLSFSNTPHTVIQSEGTLAGFKVLDLNDDGRSEVMVSGFDIGVSQIVGALLSGSIDQDIHLFQLDANNKFAEKPNFSEQVELSFSLTSGQSGAPVVEAADINGDGIKDLVLSDDESLKVFNGMTGTRMFNSRGVSQELQLPNSGNMLTIDDLNGDNKDDIMMKFGRQDNAELRSTFTILIAR